MLMKDLKSFWTFVNSTKNSSSRPSQMTDGIITVNSSKSVADMFNSFFKSIHVIDDSGDMPPHIIPNLSDDSL